MNADVRTTHTIHAVDWPGMALALGAFSVLLFRHTREAAFDVDVSTEGETRRVAISIAGEDTLDAVTRRAEAALRADLRAAPRQRVAFTWSEAPPGGSRSGRAVSLAIDLPAMAVALDGSRVDGGGASFSAERLSQQWRMVVAAARNSGASLVERVQLVDAEERALLLGRWSRSEVLPGLAGPGLLHELFEARARAEPDRIAVQLQDATMSYGELDARAKRLAAALRARGIGPGRFVAFQIPRSLDVYVAILGILKSGAAYVPLDPDYPHERVLYILSDCAAAALLTVRAVAERIGETPCAVILVDERTSSPTEAPPARTPTADDVCYVIYTSGSTGQPKGVAVTHHNATHLVRAEQHLFDVRSDDRVFQGFSVAFDAAVEEVWLAFAAGATLVAGTIDVILDGLPQYLAKQGVTVFSCVPTLLSMLEEDLPTVRLLIVGGEACPPSLAERWSTPRRRMVNTYGPTEATVIATYADLRPGEPVTIGKPIPNYRTYVLDAAKNPVPVGMPGEIHIGGPGVARGYIGRPELTASRFFPCPFADEYGGPAILYATGDLGRYNESGDIEFLGRADDQVKLRGFRVELGEIEDALQACDEIAQAVVTLREDTPGAQVLVAYVVLREGFFEVDASIKPRLGARLPAYMIPSHLEVLERLPTLTSGKVDKRALPPPMRKRLSSHGHSSPPQSLLAGKIARAWADVFGVVEVSTTDDFFLDLGGHSLLAAQMVSMLRKDPELVTLSILDVYHYPTVSLLAGHLARVAETVAPPPQREPRPPTERGRYTACTVMQVVGLYLIAAVYSTQWLAPYLTWVWLRHAAGWNAVPSLLGTLAVLLGVYPAMLVFAVAVKWMVIGRYREGVHPLWGTYYLRWWLVDRVLAVAPVDFLRGTPLLNAYYRLLGARIGKNVFLGTGSVNAFDLVSIGDDSTISTDAILGGAAIEDGMLRLGPIRVGARCVVGTRSALAGDTTMHDDAELGELSALSRGASIPARETWIGSPARPHMCAHRVPPVVRPSVPRRAAFGVLYALLALAMPLLVLIAILPGLVALNRLHEVWGDRYLLASPLVAASFVIAMCLEIVVAKWLLLGRMKPGRYPVFSAFYVRKWLFDQTMSRSLDFLGGLYATLYLRPFYALLGVRMGKNAEISTASDLSPDLLEIGEGAFVADCVSLGTPRITRGFLELERTSLGARAFVGNSAVVPAGASVGDDCLVGCLSISPSDSVATSKRGASWLGSPAIELPRRQAAPAFPNEATYEPTRALVAQRLFVELARVIGPTTGFVLVTSAIMMVSSRLVDRMPLAAFVALFPFVYAAFGVLVALVVIALKWLLVGRYRAGERPLWSSFVWRTELVAALHENLVDPILNEMLKGTPLLPWFFRALGAKIGRRVYMGTTQLTEYDLISIGDDACLDEDCTLQTHLFEDRVMKMSVVRVGEHCSIGAESVMLYDTTMERGSSLAPLSLLMKGETLPARTSWEGIPARTASSHEPSGRGSP